MSESNATESVGSGEEPEARPVGKDSRKAKDAKDAKKDVKRRAWVPTIASLFCLLVGLADILAIFKPEWPAKLHRINPYLPGTLTNVAHSADVIIGLMLLLLSHGLWRRKRRAWQGVLILLVVDIAIHYHFAHANRLGSMIVAAVLLVALLFFHNDFYATGDPKTRWHAGAIFCGLVIADLAIGLGFQSASHLAARYTLLERIHDVVFELVGASGPVSFASEGREDLYYLLTSVLGVFTLVTTVYLFLRPAQPRARLSDADASRIRGLLAKQGQRDSLGYFALRTDKSVIWSPSGKACVGYRVVSGVMLATGDPIGDPEAWPGAMQEFLTEADRHAWRPAVMGCSELAAEVWCREGSLTALELGDEAVVHVEDFSLSGRPMRNVRQMVNRVAKNGYTAEVRRLRDVPAGDLREIVRAAEAWRGTTTEQGYSMALGRIGGLGDDDCVLVTALEDGKLRAVLQFVPWGDDGLSLDLMRRDRGAQPGLNDFLIVESIKAAADLGVKRISLNFAIFRSALARGERIGAGPVLKTWRSLLLFASRWFQIESLYKFNAKFNPEWVPRFFVFPGGRDAPRVAFAAVQAEALLVFPTLDLRRYALRAKRALTRR